MNGFFLMTAEFTEIGLFLDQKLFPLRPAPSAPPRSVLFWIDAIKIATGEFAQAAKTFKYRSMKVRFCFLLFTALAGFLWQAIDFTSDPVCAQATDPAAPKRPV